jgi:hypothetical protein
VLKAGVGEGLETFKKRNMTQRRQGQQACLLATDMCVDAQPGEASTGVQAPRQDTMWRRLLGWSQTTWIVLRCITEHTSCSITPLIK